MAEKKEKKPLNYEDFLEQIQEKLGKDVIEDATTSIAYTDVVECTPESLKNALGIGGFAFGKFYLIDGETSGGKCMDEKAYILTEKGYMTVKEIFEENGEYLSTTVKEVEKKINLVNLNKELESTEYFQFNGKRKTFKIKTESGYEFIRTYKHPLLVISKNSNLIWKWVGEIEKGDYIVRNNLLYFPNNVTTIDKNIAYLLGLIIADGSIGINKLTITNDDNCVNKYHEFLSKEIGIDYKKYKKKENNNSFDYHYNSKKLVNLFYNKYGLTPDIGKDKHVPKVIRNSNKETIIEFLKGYFDSESSINEDTLEVSSASKTLLYEIKLLLSLFGINSTLRKKLVKSYPQNKHFRLFVTGNNLSKFIKEIGSNSIKVNSKYVLAKKEVLQYGRYDTIPNIDAILDDLNKQILPKIKTIHRLYNKCNNSNISKNSINNLIELEYFKNKDFKIINHLKELIKYDYEKVESVKYYGEIPTFDFTMSKTSSFEADGLINHNSTITYDIIGNVQKYSNKTKKALLIDREDSYTKEYGSALGIDNNNLVISKPKTLEDMYTTVTMALECKAFGVIVIDSITSFAPKARFEGSDQMGIESRVNSDKCRVMMEALERSNTLLIGIQQTRQKIGGFGDPTTVSGGTALPFASHCRIRITRSEIDRENEQNVMKFTVIKNKLDKPYKVGTVVYKWGKGFDVTSEYVELALEFGLIEERKKIYFPPDTNDLEIKTKKAMVAYLKDNPEYTNRVIVPLVKEYLSKNKNARNEEFDEKDIA